MDWIEAGVCQEVEIGERDATGGVSEFDRFG